MASGLSDGGMIEARGSVEASALMRGSDTSNEFPCGCYFAGSDGHVHDFLIRTHEAIAYLGERTERHVRLLHLEHHLWQLDARYAALELRRERVCARLHLVHLVETLLQYVGERRTARRLAAHCACGAREVVRGAAADALNLRLHRADLRQHCVDLQG